MNWYRSSRRKDKSARNRTLLWVLRILVTSQTTRTTNDPSIVRGSSSMTSVAFYAHDRQTVFVLRLRRTHLPFLFFQFINESLISNDVTSGSLTSTTSTFGELASGRQKSG